MIDTATNAVIKTIDNVGFEPRGLAITNDGDGDDTDETVYVTQFLSLLVPGKVDGRGRCEGRPCDGDPIGHRHRDRRCDAESDRGHRLQGGRRRARGAFHRARLANFTTGAYANQLNNIGILGNFAFVPNTGASPNGPFRFDVNTQSLLHVIDRNTNKDAGQTLNMHLAVAQQTNPARRFNTLPWAIAFKHAANEGFVVSAASNLVLKLDVDPGTGAATVQMDPSDPTRVLQIPTQSNPRGIVISPDDTRAFVMNYVSRSVTVINLTTSPESVVDQRCRQLRCRRPARRRT